MDFIKDSVEMREVFADVMGELMEKDEKVVVIDADLAKAVNTDKLRGRFPERAIDVGIAEQNMVSMAAGLSAYGYKPFVASFAPFATRSVVDQLTMNLCYAKQNVKIIGADPGITAELNGATHMTFEDIAIMRAIPGMVVYEPTDAEELRAALPVIKDYNGTIYIRLPRKRVTVIHNKEYQFELFKAEVLRKGSDVTLIASGIEVVEALKAAELIAGQGISAEVIAVHTIKPLDTDTLIVSLAKTRAAVTVENHSVIGGLYSAVVEAISSRCPTFVVPVGVNDRFGEVGDLEFLKERLGLTARDVAEAALKVIEHK